MTHNVLIRIGFLVDASPDAGPDATFLAGKVSTISTNISKNINRSNIGMQIDFNLRIKRNGSTIDASVELIAEVVDLEKQLKYLEIVETFSV